MPAEINKPDSDFCPDIKVLFQASKTIWLAPNELTLSQLKGGLFSGRLNPPGRVRLETFNSLENSLAAELSPPEADGLVRLFILNDLAGPLALALQKELNLKLEPTAADLKKLAEDLGDAFDRLKLAGLKWDQVAELPPGRFGRIVADLGRRHDREMAALNRLDRFGRRRLVLDELNSGRRFRVLEGVEEIVCRWSQRLSPFETDFLLALARAAQVKIRLKIPAWVRDENIDHGSGFDLLRAIRQLEKSEQDGLWLEFEELAEGQVPPPLAYAAENLLAPPSYRQPQPPDPDGCLRFVSVPTAYHEVEEAARRLKELLARGASPDELALVVPDVDLYAQLIDDLARRFGLAFHLRRGRPLAEYGPVKAILDLLDLWDSNWERSRLAELLRSPYFIFFDPPLDPALINRLTLASGMSDRRAGGGFELLSKIGGKDSERAAGTRIFNLLKKMEAAGSQLSAAAGWEELIDAFTDLLNDLRWPGDLNQAPEFPLNIRAADLSSAYAFKAEIQRLREALQTAPRAPEVSLANFRLWLESLLSERHLSWDRDPEGRIRVLNYYDLHGGSFEEIFFLGLNERVFPRTAPESRWWPEEFVRAASALLGRPLWSDENDNYRQEELLLAQGLGQARKRVWLFWRLGDESGRESLPSPLLTALKDLWPEEEADSRLITESAGGHGAASLEKAAGPDELILALARLDREKWPPEFLSNRELIGLADGLARRRARWAALKKEAAPGPEFMAGWLRKLPAAEGRPLVPPSFPAAFAACPLLFWGVQILGLDSDGGVLEEWPRSSEGSLLHAVLEQFFSPRLGRLWPGDESYESALSELLGILEQASEKHARENPLGRLPLWNIRRKRLSGFLADWLKREMNLAESVRPLAVEWSFGLSENDQAGPYRFDFPDGRAVFFKGRADRLDRTDAGLSVRDYKLSERADLRIYKDRESGSLQVPPGVWPILIYALAASENFRLTAEAAFEILDPAFRNGRLPALASDQPEMLQPLSESEPPYNFRREMAKVWDRLSLGVFPPEADEIQCAWCPLTLLCPRADKASPEEDEL